MSDIDSLGEDTPLCWICLDIGGELVYPCKCPRSAHARCLARWQLQSAGTRKETHCEFCDSALPDWKGALVPAGEVHGGTAPAVMNVNFDGKTYSFEVEPGPSGYEKFTAAIRNAFHLPEDSELNITFTCDEPTVPELGSLLTLQGPGAYDAAVHCASLSAARRLANQSSPRTPMRTSSLPVEFERDIGGGHHSPEEEHPEGIVLHSPEQEGGEHHSNDAVNRQYYEQYYTHEHSRVMNPFHPHTPSPPIQRHISLPALNNSMVQESRDRPAEVDVRERGQQQKRRLSGRLGRRMKSFLEMLSSSSGKNGGTEHHVATPQL